jgi:tetraacyldisaccharide 4'-kinase
LHGGYAADEPALHRRWYADAIVIEGRDRVKTARAAVQQGADIIVLDDALQHLRIARDLDIVLVSADSWDEPHRLLPAGSWREPLTALNESTLVLVTRKAVSAVAAAAVARAVQEQARVAAVATCALPLQVGATGPALAVCGIADPRAVARQLVQAGVDVQEVLAYDDHHEFSVGDVTFIEREAAGRQIIVTEKDAVKLEKLSSTPFVVATQTLQLESGGSELERLVRGTLR